MSHTATDEAPPAIAVVGMAGRFPGANNVDEFWDNLRGGVESIAFFSDEQLAKAGVLRSTFEAPNYVPARGVAEGLHLFDAAFFGYTPRDAELMDPQHRVFLECAWAALEHAGIEQERYDGLIGVYGGTSISTYLINNLVGVIGQFGPGAIQATRRSDRRVDRSVHARTSSNAATPSGNATMYCLDAIASAKHAAAATCRSREHIHMPPKTPAAAMMSVYRCALTPR